MGNGKLGLHPALRDVLQTQSPSPAKTRDLEHLEREYRSFWMENEVGYLSQQWSSCVHGHVASQRITGTRGRVDGVFHRN